MTIVDYTLSWRDRTETWPDLFIDSSCLFLSYSMLNVCDLSTDGCFTLGAAVGAAVAVSGHPFLSIFAAMAAGICSGFVTAILQTKLGVDSFLQELSLIRLFIL